MGMQSLTGLQPGDIFATKAPALLKWMLSFIDPPTDRYHYGLIWMKKEDDYIILESIPRKGITPGLLSWYREEDLEFYRVKCPAKIRLKAPLELIRFSRAHYDFLLSVKLGMDAIATLFRMLFIERKLRKLRLGDFHYTRNSSFICTEAVMVGYDCAGFNIVPAGIAPIPNAYKQAEIEGRVTTLPPKGGSPLRRRLWKGGKQ